MIRKHINPADAAALGSLVDDIARDGVPARAVEIYQGRNVVAAFDGPGGCRLNIKAFRRPNALNRLVYGSIRAGKARRAYDNALRLRSAGIDSPEPLAWVERRSCAGLLLTDSYFLSRQLDGWSDIRRCPDMPDFDGPIAAGIAALMLRLHRAGIWMKDFTPGNVLWHRREDDGSYEFALVDINRMAFGVGSRRRLMSNFGRLFPDADAVDCVARHYAAAAGHAPGSPGEKEIRSAAAAAITAAEHRIARKKVLKKLFGR